MDKIIKILITALVLGAGYGIVWLNSEIGDNMKLRLGDILAKTEKCETTHNKSQKVIQSGKITNYEYINLFNSMIYCDQEGELHELYEEFKQAIKELPHINSIQKS